MSATTTATAQPTGIVTADPHRAEGSKYQATRGLSYTEVTALIRKEINAARRSGDGVIGTAPAEIKINVKQPHPGSIKVYVTGIPQEWGWTTFTDGWNETRWAATAALKALGCALHEVAAAYNFDASDAAADFSHTRFFLNVEGAEPGSKYPSRSITR